MNPSGDHRNDELDAAWRAASREEPPAALDATIAAAARRAVGAGPGSAHRSRAWWPVAAAAVVAVVAIGIVEMTPPEQVAPTGIAPALKPAPVAEPAARRDARRDERAAAASSTTAQAKVSGTDGERAKPANPFPEQPSESGATTATPAPATDEAKERPSSGAARALAGRSKPAAANATAALDKQASDRDAKPSELPTRPADEWIRLIRRLKAEGRNDLAAKELVAFRARYQERADDLLPADLREAKP